MYFYIENKVQKTINEDGLFKGIHSQTSLMSAEKMDEDIQSA